MAREYTLNIFHGLIDGDEYFAGDVFVLYVRDEEVENDSLYHSRLRSVDRHQILSTLKGRNRVLSLNLSFSDYQKKFLFSELQSAFR